MGQHSSRESRQQGNRPRLPASSGASQSSQPHQVVKSNTPSTSCNNSFLPMGNSGLKQHYETAKKTGALKISQGKLTEFPPNLKQLEPLLRTLDLSENRFVVLPDDIGSFQLLKHLNLNHNRLVSLPEELGMLGKLESLSVAFNKLTVLPNSLSNLSHLKQVNLSGNQITDFPPMFCGLRHLDALDLSKNKITHVPDSVASLHVTELNLNQNQILSISENIADCTRLKTLRLEENCLQLTAIPPRILKDSKISILTLEGNLFDMKSFTEADGYEMYMERYTAVKKKMF